MARDYVPPDPEAARPPAATGGLLRALWAVTFCYLVPVVGGLATASLCYSLFGFSFLLALAGGLSFGYLGWKGRPRTAPPSGFWPSYLGTLAATTALAAAPLIAYAAVYYPLTIFGFLPPLLTGLVVAGLVFSGVRAMAGRTASTPVPSASVRGKSEDPRGVDDAVSPPASDEKVKGVVVFETTGRKP